MDYTFSRTCKNFVKGYKWPKWPSFCKDKIESVTVDDLCYCTDDSKIPDDGWRNKFCAKYTDNKQVHQLCYCDPTPELYERMKNYTPKW